MKEGVASTLMYSPEILTRPTFDGALLGVCAHAVVVIRRKQDPEISKCRCYLTVCQKSKCSRSNVVSFLKILLKRFSIKFGKDCTPLYITSVYRSPTMVYRLRLH